MDLNIFEDLGMTNYEAKIYLALLHNPLITAYELAEKAGLYRQVTYDTIKRLQEKGAISSLIKGKKKIFQAAKPQILFEIMQGKVDRLNTALPQLNAINKQSQQPVSVETFSGSTIVNTAFKTIIKHFKEGGKGEVLATVLDENIARQTPEQKTVLEQYGKAMAKLGIKEKIIIQEGAKAFFTKETSTYKFIPQKYFNDNPFQVFGDYVQIFVMSTNPHHLIVIKNQAVADAYRKQFEFMWLHAKEIKE